MLTLEQVRQFHYEARLLDDRQWDEWLTCYSPSVVFWMPAWGDDDKLTSIRASEISLIYYPNRGLKTVSTASKRNVLAPVRRSRAPPT